MIADDCIPSGLRTPGSTLYFAYGSNMLPEQMLERCPDSVPVGRACLGGYGFMINARGVATLRHERDGTVRGVVWRLTPLDEQYLDYCEGVDVGRYRKAVVRVRFGNNRHIPALTYIDPIVQIGRPRAGYIEKVLAGAEHFGLPGEYVSEIARWREEPAYRRKAVGM